MINNSQLNPNPDYGLSDLMVKLGESTSLAFSLQKDPEFQQTLDIIHNLGDRIAIFFSRIKKLIQANSEDKSIKFISEYFFKNFSRISENTKASQHIIAYSIKRLDWLKAHTDRIVECLKLLYSDLLAMQIDCESAYTSVFNKRLNYDFGLNFYREMENLDTIINTETAYKILGITEGESRDTVKTAFRNLAKQMHPDLNPGAKMESFIRLELAYKKVLSRMVVVEDHN